MRLILLLLSFNVLAAPYLKIEKTQNIYEERYIEGNKESTDKASRRITLNCQTDIDIIHKYKFMGFTYISYKCNGKSKLNLTKEEVQEFKKQFIANDQFYETATSVNH